MTLPPKQHASNGRHRRHHRAPLPRRLAWHDGAPATAEARHAARAFLDDAGSAGWARPTDHASETIQLVVSELLTNAHQHAPGPCGLHLEMDQSATGCLARITVWDTSPHPPAPQLPDPHRIGGRGLTIVQALSSHVSVDTHPSGKQVKADIALP
ncbi:ATP-binding protein [Streptomyces sp. NPDC058291]|jgi:anti-sigma regulatory factor (Ser/Thr protein kinase)|uniref:ATP-binding protein n=1 Tax=Streptomyces sp. NPDC058291 TaxID=3346427 RepID=UPI0036ECC375